MEYVAIILVIALCVVAAVARWLGANNPDLIEK